MTTSLRRPKDFWHPRIGRFRAGGGWYRVAALGGGHRRDVVFPRLRAVKPILTGVALNATIGPCRVGPPNRPASRFPSERRSVRRPLGGGPQPSPPWVDA